MERLPEETFNTITDDSSLKKFMQTALQQFAQIKAVHLRTQSAEKNIRSIKGELFPTLSFERQCIIQIIQVLPPQSIFLNTH